MYSDIFGVRRHLMRSRRQGPSRSTAFSFGATRQPHPMESSSFSEASRTHNCQQDEPPKPTSSSSASDTSTILQWERFEFGDCPKREARFDNNRPTDIEKATPEQLKQLHYTEAVEDATTARQLNQKLDSWRQVSPQTVQAAIRALQPFVQPDRVQRIHQVLQQRTATTHFLFENPTNPSNVFACLRTLDSFGIQYVHMVVDSSSSSASSSATAATYYQGKAALAQKRGLRTIAKGSAQWLTLRQHRTTSEAVQYLREEHFCGTILASDLLLVNAAQDIRNIDWEEKCMSGSNDNDNHHNHYRPICIVMGNEERGISDEMRDLCDATFYLPMVGFAESFNLSVATAITLAHLSTTAASGRVDPDNDNHHQQHPKIGRRRQQPLQRGNLPADEFQRLVLQGLMHSISQKRLIPALLRKKGIELPNELL